MTTIKENYSQKGYALKLERNQISNDKFILVENRVYHFNDIWEAKKIYEIFFNEQNKDSFDSNHALIYKDKISDIKIVLKDIIDFYKTKNITPNIYQSVFDDEYFEQIKNELENFGFEVFTETQRYMILKEENKMIGTLELHTYVRGYKAELGYSINPNYQGKGYATEASIEAIVWGFEELGLSRIECTTYTYNIPSQKVCKKLGFTYEGVRKKGYQLYDGSLHDIKCYAITDDEYFSSKYQKIIQEIRN